MVSAPLKYIQPAVIMDGIENGGIRVIITAQNVNIMMILCLIHQSTGKFQEILVHTSAKRNTRVGHIQRKQIRTKYQVI